MLQQGTTTRSGATDRPDRAPILAQRSVRGFDGRSVISTRSLTRSFPDALELLADVALHPAFRSGEERCGPSGWRDGPGKDESEHDGNARLIAALTVHVTRTGYPETGTAESIKLISARGSPALLAAYYLPNEAA